MLVGICVIEASRRVDPAISVNVIVRIRKAVGTFPLHFHMGSVDLRAFRVSTALRAGRATRQVRRLGSEHTPCVVQNLAPQSCRALLRQM